MKMLEIWKFYGKLKVPRDPIENSGGRLVTRRNFLRKTISCLVITRKSLGKSPLLSHPKIVIPGLSISHPTPCDRSPSLSLQQENKNTIKDQKAGNHQNIIQRETIESNITPKLTQLPNTPSLFLYRSNEDDF